MTLPCTFLDVLYMCVLPQALALRCKINIPLASSGIWARYDFLKSAGDILALSI